jgi:PBP1b-binding outer membrane lipoprotein LpoB
MKKLVTILMLAFVLQACSTSESIFELSPQQSMSITGKGPGQDAAFNPYGDMKSMASVKNLGKNSFTVRLQANGKIIDTVEVKPKMKEAFVLERGYELYLDSEQRGKAKVTFEKI